VKNATTDPVCRIETGLSQSYSRFVILRNEVTKDLSFEDLRELSRKDSSLCEH